MTRATATGSHVLHVAAVWGTTVMTLRTLGRGESFEMGDGKGAFLPIPDGVSMSDRPFRSSSEGGWELHPEGVVSGALHLHGQDEDPVAVAGLGATVGLEPGDYGLLQYGLFSLFFQYGAQPPPVVAGSRIELLALLAVLSSSTLHLGMLGVTRALMTPAPLDEPTELRGPEDEAARFGLTRVEPEPPPPVRADEPPGGEAVTEVAPRPGPAGDGPRVANPEGRIGARSPRDRTKLLGDAPPAGSLGGLAAVIDSDDGREIRETLKGIPGVKPSLSGLHSETLVLGSEPGASLTGLGSGGGGTGTGVPFAAGNLKTGWGSDGSHGPGPGGRRVGDKGDPGGPPRERPIVHVDVPIPVGPGGLSPDQVQRVVAHHLGALRFCYENEAQLNPQLRGGVTVAWQIAPSGEVTSATVDGSTLRNPRVEGCVVRQVKNWHFPESKAPTRVASPFRFGVGG
jgi:hypothetical protein